IQMYDQLLYSALIPSMSSPEKRTSKKKKKEPSPNPSLPDDFLLSCFARISTLYYPSLSLVSKSFRSLLTSPELYKVRSLSDHTECCLYVCIQFFSDLGPTWYTLCRKPDQTKSSSSSSEYVLAKVPILNSPRASFTGLVSRTGLDTKLPVSHMERGSKSMRDDLYSLSASVLDEMIYVVETQTWDPVTIGLKDGFYNESIDGKFLVVASNKEVVIYDPKKVRWDVVRIRSRMDCNRDLSAYCEIDNVLRFSHKKVIWCGEISLERRNGGCEIWGKVEWFDMCLRMSCSEGSWCYCVMTDD
ncbi:hypothetical protein HID58_011159, partial [Brassica napus]